MDQNPVSERTMKLYFPEGLRVLVVDDNLTCLKILTAMLQKCHYHVTQTTRAAEALKLLRANKVKYDIVITDVRMPEMNGFELLSMIIDLQMDIPVIMVSESNDMRNVMKGVTCGVRDYLVKPVGISVIQNIWQHVKRKIVVNPNKSLVGTDEQANIPSKGASSAVRKAMFFWEPEMHRKFVATVQKLEATGTGKAFPKKILELMDDPRLTRERVSSHLQKYRASLKKHGVDGPNRADKRLLNTTTDACLADKVLPLMIRDEVQHVGTIPSLENGQSGTPTSSHSFCTGHIGHSSSPSFIASQPGPSNVPMTATSLVPYSSSPGNFNIIGTPYHMSGVGDTSIQSPSISQPSVLLDDEMQRVGTVPLLENRQSGAPTDFHSSGIGQFGPYCSPSYDGSQSRPRNMPMTTSLVPYTCPGNFNIVGIPYHMRGGGDASTPSPQISQPGQHEGREVVASNGIEGSAFIGWPTGNENIDEESTIYLWGSFTQLPGDNSDCALPLQRNYSMADDVFTDLMQKFSVPSPHML